MSVAFEAHGETVPMRGATMSATPPDFGPVLRLRQRIDEQHAMEKARMNGGDRRMNFAQLGQERGGPERGKGVAAFEMDQLHEMGTPSR